MVIIFIFGLIVVLSALFTGQSVKLEEQIAQMLVIGFCGDDESNPGFMEAFKKNTVLKE